jgi:arsenate reductase
MAETLGPAKVVFACVANAGRSQMAAAFFNALANKTRAYAVSAGTRPGTAVHPEVVEAMREAGIDLSSATPQYLSTDLTKDAHILITMGCGDECPLVPGVERDDWPLDDPKGQPVEAVRRIRDEIKKRVEELVKERRWK